MGRQTNHFSLSTLLFCACALATAQRAPQTLPFPIHVDTTGGAVGVLGATWMRVPAASLTLNISTPVLATQSLPVKATQGAGQSALNSTTANDGGAAASSTSAALISDVAAASSTAVSSASLSLATAAPGAATAAAEKVAAAAAAGYVTDSAQSSSQLGRNQPSLGADATGQKVLAAWREGSTAAWAFSTNGGVTWSAPAPLPLPAGYSSPTAPCVAGAAFSHWYVAAEAQDASGVQTLAVLTGVAHAAVASGFIWTRMAPLPGPGDCLRWQKPSLSVARAGAGPFLVLAAQEVSTSSSPACRRMPQVSRLVGFVSRDGGASWSAPITLSDTWVIPVNGSYGVLTGAPSAVAASATTAHVVFVLNAQDFTQPSTLPYDTVASPAWLGITSTSNAGQAGRD